MKNWYFVYLMVALVVAGTLQSCGDDDGGNGPTETDFTDLLTNQIDEVILHTMESYQTEITNLETVLASVTSMDEATLASLRAANNGAYLAYQRAAVHDYFTTNSLDLVGLTNLYPIEVNTLESLVEAESRDFNSASHERATGFPAIDYMLYGPADVVAYFNEDPKRLAFLQALVSDMKDRSDNLVTQWSGLRDDFIAAGGTSNGSAVSGQLNGSLAYYEFSIREDKIGIPIGRLGPNDSPIEPDPTKIEAYYQSLVEGDDRFAILLTTVAVEEMEDLYLGTTSTGFDGQGYDDLLVARDQEAVDADIKAQFQAIYDELDSRTSITEDNNTDLYDAIQALVTLYKSDMFPLLNVQDADGANDGD